jgi:hypothetical protein
LGAQAERTLWLYEAWWNAPGLRNARGISLERGHGARVLDAAADAFMQSQEGTLLHEVGVFPLVVGFPLIFFQVVHLASMGQMKASLSLAYPRARLPSSLWHGQDWVGDTTFHEHVNAQVFVCLASISVKEYQANICQCESIMDAKYRRPKSGGGLQWEAAYHLNGVRDLASLRNGDVASALNADSYNAFAGRKQDFCACTPTEIADSSQQWRSCSA